MKKRDLEAASRSAVSSALRAEFLRILPDYAARNGWDREVLLAVGVPEEDLGG